MLKDRAIAKRTKFPALRASSRLCFVVLAVAIAAGCKTPANSGDDATTLFEPGSSTPNFARSSDGSVVLSWIQKLDDGRAELRFSTLSVAGTELQMSPAQVAASGDDWMLNWADYPSMVQRTGGAMAAHYLKRNGESKYAYGIEVVTQSAATNGRPPGAWSAPTSPHRDDTPTEHGFVSLIAEADDDLGIVWLDGRDYADSTKKGTASMAIRYAALSAAGQLRNEVVLDDRTCDCCQTDATTLSNGDRIVVYRDRSADEIRDIAFVRRTDDKWSPPAMVARDGWHIAGCPVQGPSIDAHGQTAAVAWFTDAAPTSVKVAFLEDDGSFGPPISVDSTSALGRVSLVMVDASRAAVAWLASGAVGTTEASIYVAEVHRDGMIRDRRTVAATSSTRASGFPQLARIGSNLVVAWTDVSDEPTVKTRLVSLNGSN